ncbi:MAG: glycosyltransferase family 2 protein [Thermomicrobiales bacterium]
MTRLGRALLLIFAFAQAVAGLRVAARLLRTARGSRITPVSEPAPGERVSVIVPVLNERDRLAPCLSALIAQPDEVAEILVVDGGSTDGTPGLARQFAERDLRVRLIDAAPVPADWNGKAHGLQAGLQAAAPSSPWVLTIDADVRVQPQLTRSLLAHAQPPGLAVLGVATRQRVCGAGDAVLHPALLTTLVYRFGIPGHATWLTDEVQANGQCSLYRREALERIGGFTLARASRCEDVTIARALAQAGFLTGFYEAGDLAQTAMYGSWRETWRNWPRSLPLRDRYSGAAGWSGLAEVTLAQGLPLAVLAAIVLSSARKPPPPSPLPASMRGREEPVCGGVARFWRSHANRGANTRGKSPSPAHGRREGGWGEGLLRVGASRSRPLIPLQLALLAMRLGVLAGTRRAYDHPAPTYWLSPLADFPVALRLWQSALQRQHTWRGRPLVPDTADIWSMT